MPRPRMFQGIEESSSEQFLPRPKDMFSAEEAGKELWLYFSEFVGSVVNKLLGHSEHTQPPTSTTDVMDIHSHPGSTASDQPLPPSPDS